jgi:hypothetical protein
MAKYYSFWKNALEKSFVIWGFLLRGPIGRDGDTITKD